MIVNVRPLVVIAAVATCALACGGWKRTGTSPKAEIGSGNSVVELVISHISQDQAKQFMDEIKDRGDIENIELKNWSNGTAVYVVEIRGSEAEFPAMVARIPEPGFRYGGRTSRIVYEAYDNHPPSLSFVKPNDGLVTKDKQIEVVVEVPDEDVAQVTIGGRPANRNGSRFSTTLPLGEGANDIVAVAKDNSGNETTKQVRVGLDSTPPEVSATVTVVIEGDVEPGTRVMVDGNEVEVDDKGHWKAPVKVKPGQREVEVIAIDSHGNRTEQMKPIGG